MSLDELGVDERLRLMKFVCSFAWADLEVRPEERQFIERMIERLSLGEEEVRRIAGWLEVPPTPESIDPTLVPAEHRKIFLEAIEGVIAADGEIAPEESENLRLFRDLMN